MFILTTCHKYCMNHQMLSWFLPETAPFPGSCPEAMSDPSPDQLPEDEPVPSPDRCPEAWPDLSTSPSPDPKNWLIQDVDN